ncbi:MAG: MFS transporter [Sandarakinorhabdus sp.]|jgi:MFS family permease|nr:MFS transporter [Sandarakinorhabdus sp.]
MDRATDSPAVNYTAPSQTVAGGWFLVAVLSVASVVSYIDRQIINLLVEPMKQDLGISDLQISLLQGFSFALFYAVMALPLAWVADTQNRKWVVIGGVIFWSAASFSTGLATSFALLFAARMAVGVGEATLAPAGTSMISDCFRQENLPAAVGVFTGSGFVGSGLALLVGGYVINALTLAGPFAILGRSFQPWQVTFMAVTLLSIPVLLLLALVREPVRRDGNRTIAVDDAPSRLEVISFLKANLQLIGLLALGLACLVAAQFGIGAWTPSFLIRVHGWTQLQVGQWFGPIVMAGGLAGVVGGGFAAQALAKRGVVDASLRVTIAASLMAVPFAIAFPLVSSVGLSLALLAAVLVLGTVPFGAGVSIFPSITPNRFRAQVLALYLLIANLVGYSLGPTVIAWFTDSVFGDPLAIGRSLAIAPAATLLAGCLLLALCLKPYRQSLAQRAMSSLAAAA